MESNIEALACFVCRECENFRNCQCQDNRVATDDACWDFIPRGFFSSAGSRIETDGER